MASANRGIPARLDRMALPEYALGRGAREALPGNLIDRTLESTP